MKPEADLQCKLIRYLRSNNILCFAPCNEAFMTLATLSGKRNFGLWKHYENMGMEKGVLDVWIFKAGKTYVIELKSPGGKLSPSQVGFIARLEREEIPYLVTDCYYTAVDWLDSNNIIRT